MLHNSTVDSLISATPYERITAWSMSSLGANSALFAEVMARLYELEEAGAVDLLSISRQSVAGHSVVNAVKFIRLQAE